MYYWVVAHPPKKIMKLIALKPSKTDTKSTVQSGQWKYQYFLDLMTHHETNSQIFSVLKVLPSTKTIFLSHGPFHVQHMLPTSLPLENTVLFRKQNGRRIYQLPKMLYILYIPLQSSPELRHSRSKHETLSWNNLEVSFVLTPTFHR